MTEKTPSENRRYVVICNKSDFTGYHLTEFELPEYYAGWRGGKIELKNTRDAAIWYFLNILDLTACVESVILTEKEYNSIGLRGKQHDKTS